MSICLHLLLESRAASPQLKTGLFCFHQHAVSFVPHQLFAPFTEQDVTDADLKRIVKKTEMSPTYEEVKALGKTVLTCVVLDN